MVEIVERDEVTEVKDMEIAEVTYDEEIALNRWKNLCQPAN